MLCFTALAQSLWALYSRYSNATNGLHYSMYSIPTPLFTETSRTEGILYEYTGHSLIILQYSHSSFHREFT